MFKKLLFLLVCINVCNAQLPNTDLWLFSIKNEKGNLSLEKGENITKREGYDNQPSFTEDGKGIYYVSIKEDKQADVYVYNIGSKKSVQLTKTIESEYSPALTPNKKSIGCVMVLKDSAQVIYALSAKNGSLTQYPESKFEQGELMSFDSVGYYTFLNADTVLYYKLTSPHSLRAHCLKTRKDVFLADSPVRGFKAINRNEFIYGVKDSSFVTYYKYNCVLKKANFYCRYNSVNEDIVWNTALGLMKSEGATILYYNEKEASWKILFDFSSVGIKKITRFVLDSKNKKIVVVDNVI